MASSIDQRSDILFIAKNIPTPSLKSNRVVFTIAENLDDAYHIDFLYPKEWVPFFLLGIKKYKPLVGLTSWEHKQFSVKVLTYVRLPISNMALMLTARFLKIPKIVQRYKLIHAHFVVPDGYLAFLMHQKYGIPYGITIRNSDIMLLNQISKNSNTYNTIEKSLHGASFLTCLNSATKIQTKNHFNVNPVIIPHGIEDEFILKTPPKYEDKIHITCIGIFIKTKQIDWVIEAFKKLCQTKSLSLTIIGTGPEEQALKKLADGDSNIFFTGHIPKSKVMQYLTQSQIFLLPSRSETYGLVYNEAAARHNAIIGYKNQGPCGTFIEDQEMIFIESYEEFLDEVSQLIENPAKRKMLADNALHKVSQLTWDRISKQYDALYSRI